MMRIDPRRWAFRQPIYGGNINLKDDATIYYWTSMNRKPGKINGNLPGLQANRTTREIMKRKLQMYWDEYKTTECPFKPTLLGQDNGERKLYLVATIDNEPHAYAECEFSLPTGQTLVIDYLCGSEKYGGVADELMQVLQNYAIQHNTTIALSSVDKKSNRYYENIGMTKQEEDPGVVVLMDSYKWRPTDEPMTKRRRTYRDTIDLTKEL